MHVTYNRFDPGPKTSSVWNVHCSNFDTNLLDCTLNSRDTASCPHSMDAAVHCSNERE